MRKVNLILANAAIAATLLLSSCKKDDDEADVVVAPSITLEQSTDGKATVADVSVDIKSELKFQLGIAKGDENVKFLKIEKAEGNDEASIVIVDINEKDDTDLLKYDSEEKAYEVTNNGGTYEFSLTASGNEGTVTTYTFTAKDKDGNTSSVAVKVTTNVSTTDLGSNVGFTWQRVGGADATGLSTLGLEWKSNSGGTAIVTTDAATRLVKLSSDYSSITTVEALKTAVDAADVISQYNGVSSSESKAYNDVLGVVNGGKYYLVNVTQSTVTTGTAGTTIKIDGNYKTEPTTK